MRLSTRLPSTLARWRPRLRSTAASAHPATTAAAHPPHVTHHDASTSPLRPLSASVAAARARGGAPSFEFHVAGVTFGGGQAAADALSPGDALLLTREPRNPVDPHAVLVTTPAGLKVGYVTRTHTADACVGTAARARVRSVGRAGGDGPLGVAVVAWPACPPLTIDALPPPVAGAPSLSALLPADDWAALRDAAAEAGGWRCAISGGVGPAWPVEVHEEWDVDDEGRVVTLVGVQPLEPAVHAARHALSLATPAGVAAVKGTLAGVNGWSPDEVEAHWSAAEEAAAERARGGGWTVDAGWLTERGVGVPVEWLS